MAKKKFIDKFKAEILIHLKETGKKQATFAKNCNKTPINFNQWLNRNKGMNFKSFEDMYEELGGNMDDIIHCLHVRQQIERNKQQNKNKRRP